MDTKILLESGTNEIQLLEYTVGNNSYGLPTPETLRMLADYRCEQYRTDRNGTVTFRFR